MFWRVALRVGFTSFVGDAEGGAALRGVVNLAEHVALLVGLGVRRSVGRRGSNCNRCQGDGRADDCGGTCLHGDLPGMV